MPRTRISRENCLRPNYSVHTCTLPLNFLGSCSDYSAPSQSVMADSLLTVSLNQSKWTTTTQTFNEQQIYFPNLNRRGGIDVRKRNKERNNTSSVRLQYKDILNKSVQ